MSIPVQQGPRIFTTRMIAQYRDNAPAPRFLRGFFPSTTSNTRDVSVAVSRSGELVAVDIERGTRGNRNSFSKASYREYQPPLYDEYFDVTELDLYQTLYGAKSIEDDEFVRFFQDVSQRLNELRDKIERRKELQCAQVLETGVVTMVNGDDINFNRRAESMIANTPANTWTDNNVDPYATLGDMCELIRKNALYMGGHFIAVLGKQAHDAFMNNQKVKDRNDMKQLRLDELSMPRPMGAGGTYHGRVTARNYTVDIWTYPQFYQESIAGPKLPYWPEKQVVVLPPSPNFVLAHAAVPQLLTTGGMIPQQGEYLFYDFPDYRHSTHDYGLKSAAVAVPIAIDEIVNADVIGDGES